MIIPSFCFFCGYNQLLFRDYLLDVEQENSDDLSIMISLKIFNVLKIYFFIYLF